MPEYPAGLRAPEDRIGHACDACGRVDDHPRHIILGGDGTLTRKHLDCCEAAGCPGKGRSPAAADCSRIMRDSGRARGDGLVAFLRDRMPKEG